MSWKDKNTISPAYPGPDATSGYSEVVSQDANIAVIGAGAFGGWTALSLLRKGYKVSLYDSWGAGNSRSSSGGETRLMRCVYGGNAFYTKLAMESYALWQQLEKTASRRLLIKTGNLWLAGKDDREIGSALPILEELQLPYKILTPADASTRYPFIYTSDLQSVLFEEQSGFLMARESCQVVLEQFVREGGTYFSTTLVPGKYSSGSMEFAATSAGTRVRADFYLFACGPWLKQIFPEQLGALLHISRQEVFYFGVHGHCRGYFADIQPTFIDMALSEGFYGIPAGDGRGFKVASDVRGREIDPSHENRIPDPAEIERAKAYISFRFPSLGEMPLLESRVCQYTNTPDGNFIFDQHPGAANVWFLGGGSGHGFKHGPALGVLVADVLSGKKSLPISLSLKRFG